MKNQSTFFWVIVLSASMAFSVRAEPVIDTFGSGANQFQIEFVTIGNPGNAADTVGVPTAVGRVDAIYNLGKYEISRDQILKANADGGLGIPLANMARFGGDGLHRPATGITWYSAVKFVNYLNASRGSQVAYNVDGSGNVQPWAAGLSSGGNPLRHANAYYFLPSVDEWYKGAYGSADGTWYSFPNGSNSAPTAVSGGTSGVVYGQSMSTGPADVTNAGGLSPFGTMAQGGNVWEWAESEPLELRGGDWAGTSAYLEGSYSWTDVYPSDGLASFGFRVASVPEPGTIGLMVVGLACVLAKRMGCRR